MNRKITSPAIIDAKLATIVHISEQLSLNYGLTGGLNGSKEE